MDKSTEVSEQNYLLDSFLDNFIGEFRPHAEYHEEMDWLSIYFRDCSWTADWCPDNSVALILDNHPEDGKSQFVGFIINGVSCLGISLEGEKSLSDIIYEIIRKHPKIVKNLFNLMKENGLELYYKKSQF